MSEYRQLADAYDPDDRCAPPPDDECTQVVESIGFDPVALGM